MCGKENFIMLDECKIYDFDNESKVNRFYGGASGNKAAVKIGDDFYIIKYPQNITDMNMKFPTSYGNNAVSEFIGSHFYQYMGIPVHETYLGKSRDKLVVACKDFCRDGKVLFEFNKCINSFFPDSKEKIAETPVSSGSNSTNLKHCQEVINELDAFEPIRSEVKERFWDMFVLDAVIANPDRNNGNWGILIDTAHNDSISLAPVYDNGNSLNSKWNEEKMKLILNSTEQVQLSELGRTPSVYTIENGTEEKRINPFKFMAKTDEEELQNAIVRLMPRFSTAKKRTEELILSIPVLSQIQKDFYILSFNMRIERILLPIYGKIIEAKKAHEYNPSRSRRDR